MRALSIAALLLCGLTVLASCTVRVRTVEIAAVEPAVPARVTSPVKAHLLDGSTVVYQSGVRVTSDSLLGDGERFDLRLRSMGQVGSLLLDSVAGIKSFRVGTNFGKSVVHTIGATAFATVVSVGLVLLISPPYLWGVAGSEVLEAEPSSYSIAPLFETRDVDRLGTVVGPNRSVVVEVRNEALETHFINHMGLQISVLDDGVYREVGWVPDSGPLAWKAAVVPGPPGNSLHIRLSFVTAPWRIDRGSTFEKAFYNSRIPVR